MAFGAAPFEFGTVSELRREAAVLVLLKAQEAQRTVPPFAVPSLFSELKWHILLTVRSKSLRRHPGEVCFPGGMFDTNADRNPTDAALREAFEEIGLPPNFVHIVGTLPPLVSGTSEFRIVPVVALLTNDFRPSYSSEVEVHFWAPLGHFLENGGEKGQRESADVRSSRWCSFEFPISAQQNALVFGFTAALCVVAAAAIHQRLPKFVEDANRATDNAEQLLHKMFAPFTFFRVALPANVHQMAKL
ncbi:hypothetical protein niasHT_007669 [Heterodera trifolii]|uniref:Nudix hydrolase domain-containing protein n=1 Tax=Heterodera trifolii TaxID=157864 RepID=A0ABD2LQ66_9BILA